MLVPRRYPNTVISLSILGSAWTLSTGVASYAFQIAKILEQIMKKRRKDI